MLSVVHSPNAQHNKIKYLKKKFVRFDSRLEARLSNSLASRLGYEAYSDHRGPSVPWEQGSGTLGCRGMCLLEGRAVTIDSEDCCLPA